MVITLDENRGKIYFVKQKPNEPDHYSMHVAAIMDPRMLAKQCGASIIEIRQGSLSST
jgi:hypothetical protein